MARMSGLGRLKRKLRRIPEEVRAELRTAIAQGAADIVEMQKRLAPVRTGRLRDSIIATFGDQDPPAYASVRGDRTQGEPELTAIISAGNAKVRYAHLVEFGAAPHIAGGRFEGAQHPGAPAQPFFFPSWRAQRKRVRSRIARAVGKAARKVASG